jgi:hypothetical protein
MAVTILDHTFDAKRFNPLVYDEKIINYSKSLRPGTLAYDDFWDEQDDRCLFGYKPKGMHDITGEHYFHLNMNQIEMLVQGERRKRLHAPYYRELDNRLFKITYDAKKHRYGLIVGKPRRVGLSEFGAVQLQYELIMHLRNRVGICAGKQEKADDFYKKVISLFQNVRPEYQVARLYKNDKEMKFGYTDIVNKQSIECGLESEMLIRTMFVDSTGFEGQSQSVVIFEEAGLFANLIASYKSTEPCFKEGSIQFGTPLIYGTGGQIEKGSKGYMDMWENHKAYNLEKIFIPAYEYYPGDGEVDDKTGIKAPSFFDLKTGRTNQDAALKHILEQRKIASKSKEGITKHIQSYPIKESEIFIKSKGGVLDRIKLNNQLMLIEEGLCPYEVRVGRLEWMDDERTIKLLNRCKDTKEKTKLRIKNKIKLRWVDDPEGSIKKIADPINHDDMDHKPDIAGCDSYDEEVDADSKTASDGATVVYRTYAGPTREYNLPIAVLSERGDSGNDDVFYENNVKLAIYYNYELLFEYSKIAIESYFKDVGAEHHLKMRPDLRKDLGPTKAKNEYGQRMTTDVKVLGTKLLKAEVKNNCGNIWFRSLLLDLIDYGDSNTDIAMALVMVLLYKLELFEQMVDEDDGDDYDAGDNIFDQMAYYDVDQKGNVTIKAYSGEQLDMLETFNPDIHLNDYDRAEIKRRRSDEKKQMEELKKTFENKRKTNFQDLIQEEILRSIKNS